MNSNFRTPVFFSLALSALFLLTAFGPGKDKLKGTFQQDTILVPSADSSVHCGVDSGQGWTMELTRLYRNDLFMSEEKNTLRLRVHLPETPEPGTRITFPSTFATVCYREEGKLLMFESFEALGWIQLDQVTGKKASGSIDLKLVKPHHNMSNSDYHYMGGTFKLSAGDL